MNPSKILTQLCDDLGVTVAELCRRTGQAPQNLGRKLNQETLKMEEFLELIDTLGVKFNYSLVLPDGKCPDFQFEDAKTRERTEVLKGQIEENNKTIEYLTDLGRQNLTAFYTVTGNTDIALKHIDDIDRVESCLKKIQVANKQIVSLLNRILSVQEAGLISAGEAAGVETTKGQRVLLAMEDSPERKNAEEILGNYGLVVEEAFDGEIALNMISSSKPRYYSVVLMDVQQSAMDGIETVKKIRRLPNRLQAYVPAVAVMPEGSEAAAGKALDAGFDACLTGPVDTDKLIGVLSQFI